ncbi:MAG TPA: hypothetical protein VNV63_01680 [Nitrospiria bacterium]|jgi:hypothetical protein|nr:hypothetical protein [Nitrospiria bacterium]
MIRSRKNLAMGLGILTALFFALVAPTARAASAMPQFLITWKATGSYVPTNYQGKALPTYGSQITASLEIISNGQVANLQGQTIYWYLNDTLLGGGTGAQTITFPPFGQAPNTMTLKVELPSYNGNFLIHTIAVPMVQPQAIIYAPYPNGQFSTNPVAVTAVPYFFNTASPDDLSYAWSVNNQSGANTENPEEADITLPAGTAAGTTFEVSVNVQNGNDSTVATISKTLTYQPSL